MHATSPPDRTDEGEATEMIAREETAMERVRERGDEVERIADSLNRHRHENHFAELLNQAFRSGI